MEVYIEYAIVDNMVIDYIILALTRKINKLETKSVTIILTSVFGTVIALLSPFLSGFYLVLVKILCGLLMPLFLLKKPSLKQYLVVLATFLLVSMLFGGVCFAFCSLFNINYAFDNGGIVIYKFPVGLALILVISTYFILKNLVNYFLKVKSIDKFTYLITIQNQGASVEAKAFLDSGNRLTDFKTNKPIILINFSLFSKLSTKTNLADILLKRYDKFQLKNLHEVTVESISKNSKIIVFEVENIIIENRSYNNAVIGLSLKDFKSSLNADCILSPLLFE